MNNSTEKKDESEEYKLELGTKFRVADIDSSARYDVHWLEKHKTKIYLFILVNGVGLVLLLFPMI